MTITNSAGVRFKAKPVVGSMDTSLKIDLPEDWKKVPLSRHIEQNNKIEFSNEAIERLIDDLDLSCAFSNDLRFSIEKAKQHAKEVAQAEKVEKYKRDLLNSREARFYNRFRELGATHEQAVRYAWGE